MRLTLTRRGQVVLGAAILGVVLGFGFGGRSLNAVVMPAVALLAGTGVYARRFDEPRVTRDAPDHGHQGETRPVDLFVDDDRKYTAVVEDRLPAGLRGDGRFHTVADGRKLRHEVELARRGTHTIGPCRVVAGDPLGLWKREFTITNSQPVTVFPRVHALDETAGLLSGYIGVTDEREQFDGVREYVRGDPLRDVNWKASAKRSGDLVVTEFAGEGAADEVTIAVESLSGRTDSAAEAAASVAAYLLDAGTGTGLATPNGTLDPARGAPHRRQLLSMLADLDRGNVRRAYRDSADILVRAPASGEHVEVVIGGHTRRYSEVLGDTVQGASTPRDGAATEASA